MARQAREGLKDRLAAPAAHPRPPEADYRQRLEYEIDILVKMGFAGYFLVVADIINYARQQQIPVGPGPGLRRRQPGGLCPGHHRPGPPGLRPLLRALPQPGAGQPP